MGRKSAKSGGGEGEVDPLFQQTRQAFAKDGDVSVGRVLAVDGLVVGSKPFENKR